MNQMYHTAEMVLLTDFYLTGGTQQTLVACFQKQMKSELMLLEEFLQLFLWTFDFHNHFCHVFFAKVFLDQFPAADVFLFQSKQQPDLNTATVE